jgi:uncharacterized iron-regulated protein
MRLINNIIIIVMISLSPLVWANNIHYELDVTIDTQTQKLTGTVNVTAAEDRNLSFFVANLSKLIVNGKTIATEDGHITVPFKMGQKLVINYEAILHDEQTHFVDQNNVFLTGQWYPQLDELVEYQLSVTLPKGFIATSEADSVEVQKTEASSRFIFQFNHPLDSLNLAASKNYLVKTYNYKHIAIEAYFFKEDAYLADTYLESSQKYLAMYEAMLTPYPYKRFAIVENILPTGFGMPSYTLLGRAVVHLPFILKTSLGHEILHEWFGNSVFVNYEKGNWAEGITNYLADQHYAALKGKGVAYRKQIMVDYNAYVNKNNAMPIKAFLARHNKAESSIGYGKTAMIFHQLRKRYGDDSFLTALRHFINANSFRAASWADIQHSFEEVTGDNLTSYFTQWLNRQDIPQITAENVELLVAKGKLKLGFTLVQHNAPYHLQLPITVYTSQGKTQHLIEIKSEKQKITLTLDEPPTKVVIDENYDIMRQLEPAEIPPTLAGIMGKQKIIVVVSPKQQELYQPLIKALGATTTITTPQQIKFTQLKNNSLILAGFDTPMVDMLFGKQTVPKDGVHVTVHKNPYNQQELIALLHATDANEIKAVARKLSHYGKYSSLAFSGGKNTLKTITESNNGISIFTRPVTHALEFSKVTTLNDIIPKIQDSRIIYVGEQHNQFSHHINQLMVIKRLHEAGYKVAVGMEMFQIPYQKVLNDYIAGKIDEIAFLKQSNYFNNWRLDYNLYKPIIDYVKTTAIPLIALNIDKPIIDKVARKGIHNLTATEKQQLPTELDLSNNTYRQNLYQVFLAHQKSFGHHKFEYFLQSQAIWDETMAQSAQKFLLDNPNTKLIILAGNGHLRYKYGIPNRLYRRNHYPFTVILQDEYIDKTIGDYVLFTDKIKGKTAPKIGVMIKEEDKQVIIVGVSNKTPAQKAGLKKKDVITQLAGQKIQSIADLKLVLFNANKGSTVTIQVIRDGKLVNFDLTLFGFRTHH